MEEPLREVLIGILGRAAYSNGGKVPVSIQNMFKSLYYLEAQIQITAKMEDKDERKEYAKSILDTVRGMLIAKEE